MADSIAPVEIGTDWTDLYAETGFSVGTPLLVLNTGPDVRVAISATKPTAEIGTKIPFGRESRIDGQQSGAWVRSSGAKAVLYVQSDSGGAARITPFFDNRVIDGDKAFTVQPYTELNVKQGLQYYARVAYPLGNVIAAGATKKVRIQTGAKIVSTKLRVLDYIGEELKLSVYSGPTGVTGGTPITVYNWNLRDPVATTVTATQDVTTSTDGTLVVEPEYFFGGGATGQRVLSSIPQGYERIIPENSDILVTLENTSASTARAQYFLTWFEGNISTEIP